jgi:hypothetical protein
MGTQNGPVPFKALGECFTEGTSLTQNPFPETDCLPVAYWQPLEDNPDARRMVSMSPNRVEPRYVQPILLLLQELAATSCVALELAIDPCLEQDTDLVNFQLRSKSSDRIMLLRVGLFNYVPHNGAYLLRPEAAQKIQMACEAFCNGEGPEFIVR